MSRVGNTSAVVLLSGGLDSATVLAAARRDGFAPVTLAVDYGQRHRHELIAAERVAAAMGVRDHRVIRVELRAVGGSALTDEIEVPKGPNQRLVAGCGEGTGIEPAAADKLRSEAGSKGSEVCGAARIPITYVPARNMVLLSLAAGLAEVVGARDVFIGVNAVDYSGYPDCRPEFIRAFEAAANLGTKAGVEAAARGERWFTVHAPLVSMSKAEIIRLGVSLGVDYSLTHSCYDPDERGRACGRCESCGLRAKGFREAVIADPTIYAHAER